jgi:hypothetical protein
MVREEKKEKGWRGKKLCVGYHFGNHLAGDKAFRHGLSFLCALAFSRNCCFILSLEGTYSYQLGSAQNVGLLIVFPHLKGAEHSPLFT